MMGDLIERLRLFAPSLAGRVMGAADEAGVIAQPVTLLPAAFVHPLTELAEPSAGDYHLSQMLVERWAVVVVLDASADPLGYAAAAAATGVIRRELWAACLGWLPDPACEPMRYGGARVVKRDAARLWMAFTFEVPRLLTESDGRADPNSPAGGPEDQPLDSFERLLPGYVLPTTLVAAGADRIELAGNTDPLA